MNIAKKKIAAAAKTYHHGNLRDALITAAAELIHESGSDDIAMTDAARRAGVSNAAPYRHFRDKEDLLHAVSELGFLGLNQQTQAIQAQHATGSIECIIALGKGYISYVTSRPAFFDLMWGKQGARVLDEFHEKHLELRVNGFWILVNQVEAWCKQQQLPKVDPMDLTLKLWAMAIGLSHLSINNHLQRFVDDVDPYELLSSSTHAFLLGVKGGPQ